MRSHVRGALVSVARLADHLAGPMERAAVVARMSVLEILLGLTLGALVGTLAHYLGLRRGIVDR